MKEFLSRMKTMFQVNWLILKIFRQELSLTDATVSTGYPKIVKFASRVGYIVCFFLLRPMYKTPDLTTLSLTLAAFASAWIIILISFQDRIEIPAALASKFTQATAKIVQSVADTHLRSEDASSKMPEVDQYLTSFIPNVLSWLLILLVPVTFIDGVIIITSAIISVVTNNLPAWVSFANYSFATWFLSVCIVSTLRILLVMWAMVTFRVLANQAKLDELVDGHDGPMMGALQEVAVDSESESSETSEER